MPGAPRVQARVGDESFTVETRDHVSQVAASGGEPRAIAARYLGHGRMMLVEGETQRLAWVAEDGDRRWVFCDGEVTIVELTTTAPARRPSAAGPVHDALTAPMPATVVRVVAPAGTRVARGATVLLLEAMKMELPLRAPHDAVVTAVHCAEGDLVQPNVTLVELDEVTPDAGDPAPGAEPRP